MDPLKSEFTVFFWGKVATYPVSVPVTGKTTKLVQLFSQSKSITNVFSIEMDFVSTTTVNGYLRNHEGQQIPLVNSENIMNQWVFYVLSFSNIQQKVRSKLFLDRCFVFIRFFNIIITNECKFTKN